MRKYYLILFVLVFGLSCNKSEDDGPKPIIELTPPLTVYMSLQGTYKEPGYVAYELLNGDTVFITDQVEVSDNIDDTTEGDYQVFYNVTASNGVSADQKVRAVKVVIGK